jgi:hypothetical protein
MRFENKDYYLTVYPCYRETGMDTAVIVFGYKTPNGDEVICREYLPEDAALPLNVAEETGRCFS